LLATSVILYARSLTAAAKWYKVCRVPSRKIVTDWVTNGRRQFAHPELVPGDQTRPAEGAFVGVRGAPPKEQQSYPNP
jgi:hypothetical protein